ncbi:hypothetical protein ABZX30_15435, partial [Streptomyces sp. NPDC004542]|uniref:hypothetical protein n=1 Tax=Streptomyces sp. NPDC004542 TaxID=3154281 RepID=UPI0033BAF7DC
GSGKTTLTALVPRLHEVTSGRITLDGVDITAHRAGVPTPTASLPLRGQTRAVSPGGWASR